MPEPDSGSPPCPNLRGNCETCDGPVRGLAVGEDSALGQCVRCGTVVVVHAHGGREVYRPQLVDRARLLDRAVRDGQAAAEWVRLNLYECLYRPAFRRPS